jgi:hypothetical protein
MTDPRGQPPRPGSPDAGARGCRCPVVINLPVVAGENVLIAPDCPLHRPVPAPEHKAPAHPGAGSAP